MTPAPGIKPAKKMAELRPGGQQRPPNWGDFVTPTVDDQNRDVLDDPPPGKELAGHQYSLVTDPVTGEQKVVKQLIYTRERTFLEKIFGVSGPLKAEFGQPRDIDNIEGVYAYHLDKTTGKIQPGAEERMKERWDAIAKEMTAKGQALEALGEFMLMEVEVATFVVGGAVVFEAKGAAGLVRYSLEEFVTDQLGIPITPTDAMDLAKALKDGTKILASTASKNAKEAWEKLWKASQKACDNPNLNCFVAGTPVATANGARCIEAISVGERVLTPGAISDTNVNPATWRSIALAMPNPESPSDMISVEVLRPLSWIANSGGAPGKTIWLDLDELGLAGPAVVKRITACPEIQEGEGRVVLTTLKHRNGHVARIYFEGQADALTVTETHRLYSITRGDWVPVAMLDIGEELKTKEGSARVVSMAPLPGIHTVYNLEVESEHCYYAGSSRVLGHNACPTIKSFTEANALLSAQTIGMVNSTVTNSGRTIIGSYPQYRDVARANGHSYFDIGDAHWNALGDDVARGTANRRLLDIIAAKRDIIESVTPFSKVKADSWTALEVDYLCNVKGYTIKPGSDNILIPPP